jgi:hypothetical protein
MKTCPYCGSELRNDCNRVMYEPFYICDFCDLEDVEPSEDGKRICRFYRKSIITDYDIKQPLRLLMEYHTYDLLIILGMLREERRGYFNLLSTFKKAGDEFKESEEESIKEYEIITRRVWSVESLLVERIGYVPRMISNKLLNTVLDRVENSKEKAMVFNK